jgi:hypothetical protein
VRVDENDVGIEIWGDVAFSEQAEALGRLPAQ